MKFNKGKLIRIATTVAPIALLCGMVMALVISGNSDNKEDHKKVDSEISASDKNEENYVGELESITGDNLMAENDDEKATTEEPTTEEPTTEEPTTEEPKPDMFVANVKEFMNVRAEPNSDSELVGKLYVGSGGLVLERGEEWSLITSGNVTGYVWNKLVLFDEAADEKAWEVADVYAYATVNILRLRKGPSTKKDVLCVLNEHAKVSVIDMDNGDGWAKVKYGKYTGYIYNKYLDFYYILDNAMTLEEEAAWKAEEEAKRLAAEEAARKKKEAEEKAIKEAIENSKFVEVIQTSPYKVTEEEAYLLACLVHAEARGEPYEGKLAVANVVLNRLNGGAYGDTIKDVIYAPYQFSVVNSGTLSWAIRTGPNADCIKAAKEALSGVNNVPRYANFCTLYIAKFKKYAEYTIIGNQVFYRRK